MPEEREYFNYRQKESAEQGFYFHKSNDLILLLPDFFEIFSQKGSNPLTKKYVVVQSGNIGRWLALKTAERYGVCANIVFVSPEEFLRKFAEENFGIDTKCSILNRRFSEWTLFSILKSDFILKPELLPVKKYLEGNDARAFDFARNLSKLFADYFVFRPYLIEAWKKDELYSDDPDERWQKEIFTQIYKQNMLDCSDFSASFIKNCETLQSKKSVESTLLLFGISMLNKYTLNMFWHLSALFPVHIFSVVPTSEFGRNSEGETLFGKFGTANSEFLSFMAESASFEAENFKTFSSGTLLSSMQQNIFEDSTVPDPAKNDDSIQINVCFNKMREVEVLHDSLLKIFKENSEMTPGDITVMSPKIDEYVPYISAVFGSVTPHDKNYIPWIISDANSYGSDNISETFLDIVKLNDTDFEKSAVLKIFKNKKVCTKFNITEEDLPKLEECLEKSGIKWGLDANFMKRRIGSSIEQNTWDFGLGRILMSRIMPFSKKGFSFKNILPLDSFDSETAAVLDNFIVCAKELFRFCDLISGEKSPQDFKVIFNRILDFFFVCDESNFDEIADIRGIAENFAEYAEKSLTSVSPAAVCRYFEDELSKNRKKGVTVSPKVTFCSYQPFQIIPCKVICLLGMDEKSFPRSDRIFAFNLIEKTNARLDEPRYVSAREKDLYLFLETLMNAKEKLIISYEAQSLSEESKKRLSPAMPVTVLEDYIAVKTACDSGIEQKYPLFPFSKDYFLQNSGFSTFSELNFNIAEQLLHVKQNAEESGSIRVSSQNYGFKSTDLKRELSLEDLISFFKDPAKYYFTKTVQLKLQDIQENNEDEECYGYDALQKYKLSETYFKIARISHGINTEELFFNRMRGEGLTPFALYGEEFVKKTVKDWKLPELSREIGDEKRTCLNFSLVFDNMNTLMKCSIEDVSETDLTLLFARNDLKAKHKLQILLKHYAMNAAGEHKETAVFISSKNKSIKKYRIYPLEKAEAMRRLSIFIELWLFAQNEIPLYKPETFDEYIKSGNKNSEGDGKNDGSDFIEKICMEQLENEASQQNPSQYYILAAEQFEVLNRKGIKTDFHTDQIAEIANFIKEFDEGSKRKN